MNLESLSQCWDTFFHKPQPLFPLAVFRFVFGLLVFFNAALLVKHIRRLLAVDGILSFQRFEMHYGRRRLSLLNVLPATNASVYGLVIVNGLAGLALAAGAMTRISAIIVFLTIASIHHRNRAIFHSGDTLMRLMSFLLMFSPAGLGWSVDAIRLGAWEAVADPWCLRLMQLQVSFVYIHTVAAKLKGSMWRDGTAAWYPINCDSYTRFRLPSFMERTWLIKFATWGTLALELGIGVLIWIEEFRTAMLLAGFALHLIFEYFMNLQLFGWIMLASLLLFL